MKIVKTLCLSQQKLFLPAKNSSYILEYQWSPHNVHVHVYKYNMSNQLAGFLVSNYPKSTWCWMQSTSALTFSRLQNFTFLNETISCIRLCCFPFTIKPTRALRLNVIIVSGFSGNNGNQVLFGTHWIQHHSWNTPSGTSSPGMYVLNGMHMNLGQWILTWM